MKRIVMAAVMAAATLAVVCTAADDRGPWRWSARAPLGAATVTPLPAGERGMVTLDYVMVAGAVDTTQTVSAVISQTLSTRSGTNVLTDTWSTTNVLGTLVITATDNVLSLSDAPPLFAGDSIIVTGSATACTNLVTVMGHLWE